MSAHVNYTEFDFLLSILHGVSNESHYSGYEVSHDGKSDLCIKVHLIDTVKTVETAVKRYFTRRRDKKYHITLCKKIT